MILNLVGQHDIKAATLIDNNWQVSLQSLLFELLLNPLQKYIRSNTLTIQSNS
jgi:hypothetical protein